MRKASRPELGLVRCAACREDFCVQRKRKGEINFARTGRVMRSLISVYLCVFFIGGTGENISRLLRNYVFGLWINVY